MAEQQLNTIVGRVDASAAIHQVLSMTGDASAEIQRRLYYPYYRFSADCQIPTLGGRKAMTVDCLVDGVDGLGATTDPYSVDTLMVPTEDLLRVTVSSDDAWRAAHRIVTHQLTRRLRMLASFDTKLESHGVIYRCFWIIRVSQSIVTVDSLTGGVQPLNLRAA